QSVRQLGVSLHVFVPQRQRELYSQSFGQTYPLATQVSIVKLYAVLTSAVEPLAETSRQVIYALTSKPFYS
ncbi:MAG: hypothetical protein ACI9Y1_002220, partial [Lentisphaeria bacterium]